MAGTRRCRSRARRAPGCRRSRASAPAPSPARPRCALRGPRIRAVTRAATNATATPAATKTRFAASLPASSWMRRGSRTSRLRRVPCAYSWATAIATVPSTITPSIEPVRDIRVEKPSGRERLATLSSRCPLVARRVTSTTPRMESAVIAPALPRSMPRRRIFSHSLRKARTMSVVSRQGEEAVLEGGALDADLGERDARAHRAAGEGGRGLGAGGSRTRWCPAPGASGAASASR